MRKNLTKQYSKRPWRTPSPSSPNDLKSPNYLRGNFHRIQGNKSQKVDGNCENKSKPAILNFRNHIVELKEQTNKLSNVQMNNNKHVANQYLIKNQQKPSNNEIDSYNSYFTKASSAYSTIMNNNGKGNNKNRNHGHKAESNSQLGHITFNYTQNQSQSTQKQSMKRMTEQNLKLRKSLKEIQENYQKIMEQNKKLQQELKYQKSNKSQIKNEQLQRENLLQRQIKSLKEQIEIANGELKISNLQIYKMKQELFQYQIHSQKTQNESKDRAQHKKIEKSKSNHKLSSKQPQSSPIQSPKQIQQCPSCKFSQKIIINLNNAIEYKMLEVNRRDLTIQSLLSDLQKVEQQLKMFDKPKLIFKKMSLAMDAVNQSAILEGLRNLNQKLSRNIC